MYESLQSLERILNAGAAPWKKTLLLEVKWMERLHSRHPWAVLDALRLAKRAASRDTHFISHIFQSWNSVYEIPQGKMRFEPSAICFHRSIFQISHANKKQLHNILNVGIQKLLTIYNTYYTTFACNKHERKIVHVIAVWACPSCRSFIRENPINNYWP